MSPLFISAETPRRSVCHHNLKTFTVLPGEEKKNLKKITTAICKKAEVQPFLWLTQSKEKAATS